MDKQNIETIYGLTPLQQAFLWHSLQTSVSAGLIHMRCRLRGPVDGALLQRAWKGVVGQHGALRTSVHWQGVKQPLQVVAKGVTMPWTELDWRGQTDQPMALSAFLAQDRHQGFDLTQAPISRLALIRLGETEYELVWSCHHLLLDGWSGALVFNQVFDRYERLREGESAVGQAGGPSYQGYVRWLKQQNGAAAEEFWRDTLQGLGKPTGLLALRRAGEPRPEGSPEGPEGSPEGLEGARAAGPGAITFSAGVTAGVQEFLRSHRLTLNTLMQGLWAMVLYQYSGHPDIVFGATVSGRQGDLAGVEAIVGLLINVLPVRTQVDPTKPVIDWLQELQTHQAKANHYGYASLDQIQSWSGMSGRLFDSLLVIENYPIETSKETSKETSADGSLQIDNIQSGLVSTYDLTVIVKPGDTLTVILRAEACHHQGLNTLLTQFQTGLETILQNPHQPMQEILPPPVTAPPAPDSASPLVEPKLSRDQLEGTFFAPRNPLELHLSQIWESVLGVSPLSIEDNFFEVGGNSLLAVQLFNQMQQQLNCDLPLATLFQASNIRQFAALLSQEQPLAPWSSLVPIQTSGSRLPLFFHGGSADALTWARFSHLLGTDRPFYGLQRPDLDGSEVTHTTVESLATDCIQEMRMVQPQGPYLVGGHCLGGAVAFEIAQQLQADGEAMEGVILIDSYRPGARPKTPWVNLQNRLQLGVFWVRKNYYYHGGWQQLAQLPPKIWQKLLPTDHSLNQPPPPRPVSPDHAVPTTDSLANPPANPPANSPANSPSLNNPKVPYEYRYARAQRANELAAERYDAQPYGGRVKLFCAEIQILDWSFGRALGWQTVAQDGVELTKIPGFFGNLFNQRSTPLLVEQVKKYLAELR